MWEKHTCLVVILAFAVSSSLSVAGQQKPVLSHCPDLTFATLPPKNKAPLPVKRNTPVRLASAPKTSGTIKLDSIIEVSSDITTNQIWTAGNTYHITTDISVQALLVIEPGTTVTFASGTTMAVDNGGALISTGTPDNPIVYTSDSATPNYGDYNCPIYIRETASASTKVTYSYIEYANTGIATLNKRLDNPIEDNYFYSNTSGIVESGINLTDIQNNLIYGTDSISIEIFFTSDSGQADASSHILIKNNTCDYYQYYGIFINGVENSDQAGEVTLSNNVVSGAYQYGVVLANGWMYPTVANTGYYDNVNDRFGYVESEEYNPVYETTNPYVTGTGILPTCYLRPNSTFVNASDEYIEQTRLIGKTTDINGFPDSNKADLGFHYPNWHFSNAGASNLTADFDNSYAVDFNDLMLFADYWLYDYNDNYNCWSWDFDDSGLVDLADFEVIAEYWLTSFDFVDFADFANYWRRTVDYKFQNRRFDLNGDGFVNFKDYAMFADQWRQTTQSTDPPIAVAVSGDSRTGYVNLDVSGCTPDIMQTYFFVDGQYMGERSDLDVSVLGSGMHELKAVSIDINDKIICSNLTQVTFSCPFNYCAPLDSYELNEPYYFHSFYQGSGNITVEVFDEGKNLVWSQVCLAQNISGFVPAEITAREDLDSIVFTHSSGSSSAMSLDGNISILDDEEDDITKPFVMGFNPNKISTGVRSLLILPYRSINLLNGDVEGAVTSAYKAHSVLYYKLKVSNATYQNVAWFARNRNIEYIYYAGHGNYKFKEVLRTAIGLYDGNAVSVKKSDFVSGGAPSWCETLPGSNEKTAYSLGRIWYNSNLKFVYFDCCLAGRLRLTSGGTLVEGPSGNQGILAGPSSDMSWALGMAGGGTAEDHFYQGWWGATYKSFGMPIYDSFSVFEWTHLKEGENLYDALYDATQDMWKVEYGDQALNMLRVYGMGDMTAVEIE